MADLKKFLMKWIFRLILTVVLLSVSNIAEISSDSSMLYPHTNTHFYPMNSAKNHPIQSSENNQSSIATANSVKNAGYFKSSISIDPKYCMEKHRISCDPSNPYSNLNGSCNNLAHPTWGTALECYLRYLPASYEGFDKLRKSANGDPLPPVRDITLNIFKDVSKPSNVSFMFTIYGQIVAHDISRANVLDIPVPCCNPEYSNHPCCVSISIKNSDPFYSKFKKTCLPLHRTQSCTECKTSKKQQTNAVTAALDASMVYGTNEISSRHIRANDGTGKLMVNSTKYGDILPSDPDPDEIFCPHKTSHTCFLSGDVRVNQQSVLSGISTYNVREHNRIATKLKNLNPHWKEEKLFQEARKINIATLQCITFKEYLPALLGRYIMDQFNLTIKNSSEGTNYNPHLRIGVSTEFSSAAFRLHSMIPKSVGCMDMRFTNLYQNPYLIRNGYMDNLMQGACKVPSQKYGHYYADDLTNYFAKKPGDSYGLDLVSLDLQRGRDHGMPPYVEAVRFCSEGRVNISTFDDLAPSLMTPKNAQLLKENYQSVEDVDLWVGMQMEKRFPGSVVGPTSVCIIAKQFYTEKFGDRFYFEHEGEAPSFTTAQRNSIKRCSLSRFLCDNSNMTHLQKDSMLLPSKANPEVPCEEIPEIDLSLWTESSAE